MGVETEYAVHGVTPTGPPAPREVVVRALIDSAIHRRPWLPDTGSLGFFLSNGGRLYRDAGLHPEFATPECADPWEVLRYVRAGDRLLADAAERVPSDEPSIARVDVFRNNVDYWSGSTWGSHESYLHRADVERLPAELIPHLVSRLIYCGAGGFDPGAPGPEFVLSPRAAVATATAPGSSGRPIFDYRDEPLASTGFHRLHVTFAENQCCDLGIVLRVGSTALVLAAIEAGWSPGRRLALADPGEAVRTIIRDPGCRALVRLEDGGRLTAIEIQRRYLGIVMNLLARRSMPPWAGRLCRLWSDTLDRLERGAEELVGCLDWPLKRALFRSWTADRVAELFDLASPFLAPSWSSLGEWGGAVRRVGGLLAGAAPQCAPTPDPWDSYPPWAVGSALLSWVRARHLDDSLVARFAQLHRDLLEADVRFGQLGPNGILERLTGEGHTEHRMVQERDVVAAMEEPPAGRARYRGRWVRLLGRGSFRAHVADWERIRGVGGRPWLDLSDPYGHEVRWQPCPVENDRDVSDLWPQADMALFE